MWKNYSQEPASIHEFYTLIVAKEHNITGYQELLHFWFGNKYRIKILSIEKICCVWVSYYNLNGKINFRQIVEDFQFCVYFLWFLRLSTDFILFGASFVGFFRFVCFWHKSLQRKSKCKVGKQQYLKFPPTICLNSFYPQNFN